MSVFKRGSIWWYDFTVRGQRYRASTGARLKEDAIQIEKRDHRRALLGSLHEQPLTLEEAADQWFVARAQTKKSASDIARRIVILLRHMDGKTPVSDIGSRQITAAINSRHVEPIRRGVNRIETGAYPTCGTVNRDIIDTTLRPILNYAATNLEAPVKRIPWAELRLKEPRQRVRWFSDDEIAAIAQHLPHWHRPLLFFILRYGVRLGEAFFPLAQLRGEDIYTRVRKNGPQVITLLPEDAAEIRARAGRAAAAGLDTVWFREMKNGALRPIKPRGFQSACGLAIQRAGIQDARAVHDARHHAATMMLRGSGNIAAVKELLGHESIQSTMRYAHTDREDLRRTLRHVYGTTPDDGIIKSSKYKSL